MKCPNCSFNNIASAATCKICGTELEIVPGSNNDTLALDEALKGIFAPKIRPLTQNAEKASEEEEPEEETISSWEPMSADTPPQLGHYPSRQTYEEGEKQKEKGAKAENGVQDAQTKEIPVTEEPQTTIQLPKSDFSYSHHDEIEEEEKSEPFFNPLTANPVPPPSPKEEEQKKAIVPVYESAKEGIDIDEEAENFLALPKDTVETSTGKKKRNKADEIAAIAMVVLIICLGTLIYFAVQMSRTPAPMPITTPPPSVNSSPSSTLPVSSKSTTTTSSESSTTISETSSSSSSTSTASVTAFDEGYFTKTGNLSGGNGTESDTLSKVRMGNHHYFHRFVFDFMGNKIPTYYVSILEGGYLVQMRVENIREFTQDYGLATWTTVAKSIEISADTSSSILINIRMYEPAMVYTYGLEDPGRIVLDIRGDSNKD